MTVNLNDGIFWGSGLQPLKGRVNRYSIRESAANRYCSDEFWYVRKGGVSGLTQRCFLRHRREIDSFLKTGYLVRSGIIDVEKVSRLVAEVSVGAINCPKFLINLFTVNIYTNHWRDCVDEF